MIDNNKVSNIPCRLHNVGEGGVAGADEVIDDNKGKSQQQINAEVDQILGAGGSVDERIAAAVTPKANSTDVYAKTETYNKTELNNMITTPEQGFVTVTATDETTDVTDVLPATGEADTIYRVGNWDGTQYNDSVFSEYAWNGSAYIKLSTKSQIGEVYDISANHANTKYADLAAALGSNGANIPQSLRKGGMSVKFVQSSDNTYVQYRYMGTAVTGTPNPFLNIANWQGVDIVPTDNSKNTVESGGIASMGDPLHMHFDYINTFAYPRAAGYISSSTSTWSGVGGTVYHAVIPIADLGEVGDTINIYRKTNDLFLCAFLGSYNVVLHGNADVIGEYIRPDAGEPTTVEIPAGAAYLYFLCSYAGQVVTIPVIWKSDDIDNEKNQRIASDLELQNEIAQSKKVEQLHLSIVDFSKYSLAAGNITTADRIWRNLSASRHYAIPISDVGSIGDTIKFYKGENNGQCAFLSEYSVVVNADAHVIGDALTQITDDIEVTIPEGANYLYILYENSAHAIVIPKVVVLHDDVAELQKSGVDIDWLMGRPVIFDNGTTYDYSNKKYNNRVGTCYPMEGLCEKADTFEVSVKDVTLNEGNTVWITLLNQAKLNSSSAIVAYIKQDITSDIENYRFTIPAAYKAATKYIGVYIYNSADSEGGQSFKSYFKALGDERINTLSKDVEDLGTDVSNLTTEMNAIEQTISGLSGGGDTGGDDCLFEKKNIQSNMSYYLDMPQSPANYDDGMYLENKVKKVPKNGQSFVFITDTHIETPRIPRNSDVLMSYIKKRCGINVGVFGGDCVNWNTTKYLAANVVSEYAAEFFGTFGKHGLWAHGNHDANSPALIQDPTLDPSVALISDKEIFDRTVKTIENEVVFDDSGLEVIESIVTAAEFEKVKYWWKMHYFKDDIASKTRYIILESGDNSEGAHIVSNTNTDSATYDVLWVQYDFVVSALRTIPEGYNAVISCHQIGSHGSSPDYNPYFPAGRWTKLLEMLSSYKTKSVFTMDLSDYSPKAVASRFWTANGGTERSFNFTNHKGNCNVILITGHQHNEATFACQTVNGTYGISRVCEHAKSDVPAYSSSSTYAVGDEVVYNGEIYACRVVISEGEAFNSSKWYPLLDKDALENDAIYLLWRHSDIPNKSYAVAAVGYWDMTAGTVNEQSFDVVTFNGDTLDIVNIGEGGDISLPLR